MLYSLFKLLFTPAIHGYFKSIYVQNAALIPASGPVIFAVNHTSAFMDPILIAVKIKRNLHFLARGESFNSSFTRFFYGNLNMLPIYRPETTPGEVHKNKFAFQKSHLLLIKGKAIIIFPEGFSETGRKLRPIKSGLARLAFGAEMASDFGLDLKIIPVGINYSNPHHFRSDVLINVGNPVNVAAFKDLYLVNDKEAQTALTDAVAKSLEKSLIVISDERLEKFVLNLEKINEHEVGRSKNQHKLISGFNLLKENIRKINEMARKNPENFRLLELKLNNYVCRLNKLNIKDEHIGYQKYYTHSIFRILYLVAGLPFFLAGITGNCLPFSLTGFLSKKIVVRDDFVGSLKLTGGMFIFLIYYSLMCILVGYLTNIFYAVITPLVLYVFGLFALNYLKHFMTLKEDIKNMFLIKRSPEFVRRMQNERFKILHEISSSIY